MTQLGGTYQEFMYSYNADVNLSIIADNVIDKQTVLVSDMMDTVFTQTEVANTKLRCYVYRIWNSAVGLRIVASSKSVFQEL